MPLAPSSRLTEEDVFGQEVCPEDAKAEIARPPDRRPAAAIPLFCLPRIICKTPMRK
jgi:hypothetical protein